jgi:hypothetical protein
MTVLVAIFPSKQNNCRLISFGNGTLSAAQNLDHSIFPLRPSRSFACAAVYSRTSFQSMGFYFLPDE